MAKASQQSIGTLTVWMIVFVAMWLTATVFLVILYTGQEELRNENHRLSEDSRRLISTNERTAVQLVQDAKPEGPTVVGLLESARAQTAELATGTGADDAATVRTKRDQVLDSIIRDGLVSNPKSFTESSLLTGLTMLYETFKAENALRRAADERVIALDAEVAKLAKLNADQKNDLDERAGKLSAQLADAESSRSRYRTERDAAVAKIEQEFAKSLAENDTALRQDRQRLSVLERDNNELQKRFAAQQAKFGEVQVGATELATARRPDGRVLTAIPGDEVVYIDLGQKNKLLLGTRFAVYASETGIPPDGRAKAHLEVVSVAPASAECRIIRVEPNEVVLPGDLIANPVYDPQRSLTFMTIGEFDLDHDGKADSDGVATVQSMITSWGGTLTQELTALTDFVVLGIPPRRPRELTDPTAEQTERQRVVQDQWDRFQRALASAQNLAVPILPQEVFLSFLGYNNRVGAAR